MGKNFTAAFAVCLLISSLPLACGDDEDDGGGGKAGKGGTNTGGAAGSGTGGRTGGTGGSGTGGRTGGTGGGGSGRGGAAGSGGMTGGTAGSMGGAPDGGVGGEDGGMGGVGGDPGPMAWTCAALCAKIATTANCSDNSTCEADICPISLGAACDDEAQALLDCMGNGPDSNFSCMTNKPIYDYGTGTCDAEYDASLTCVP